MAFGLCIEALCACSTYRAAIDSRQTKHCRENSGGIESKDDISTGNSSAICDGIYSISIANYNINPTPLSSPIEYQPHYQVIMDDCKLPIK